MNTIELADNLEALPRLASGSVPLIYIDPPFNTGREQRLTQIRTVRDDVNGDRVGFGGHSYRTQQIGSQAFSDVFDDFVSFIELRMVELHRILTNTGSLFLHIDQRESHYCKVLLDQIFGRDCFQNEIIWSYDFGGRSKRKWPTKHDTIFWYTKDPTLYTFNYDAIDRIPYLAPSLVGKEKAERGKTPTDVWWQTIVPTNGKERVGYPTQKPLAILNRIVRVHSNPGDLVLDCFAGSGTTGAAAARNKRRFHLIDNNPEAAQIMAKRLEFARPSCANFEPEVPHTEFQQRMEIEA